MSMFACFVFPYLCSNDICLMILQKLKVLSVLDEIALDDLQI